MSEPVKTEPKVIPAIAEEAVQNPPRAKNITHIETVVIAVSESVHSEYAFDWAMGNTKD